MRHSICDGCWFAWHPERPTLGTVNPANDLEVCCSCGKPTRSGIYVREMPSKMQHCDHERKRIEIRPTRVLVLSGREFICWKTRVTVRDGTVYEGNEMATPLDELGDEERELAKALPRVVES
jgi:hypothetical protein